MRKTLVVVFFLALVAALSAQERVDQDVFWKIRQEATSNSQIMKTLHVLSDVYAPRLTGSPNLKAAGEWAIQQMQTWGLKNGHLEPWDFGRPGWLNERLSAHIISPVKDALVVEAIGWTPGTSGVVRGAAMQIAALPAQATQQELNAFFDKFRAGVKGKIVLVGAPTRIPISFNPPALRLEEADLERQFTPGPAAPAAARGRGAGPGGPQNPPQGPRPLTVNQITDQFNDFLVASGALVRINDAAREGGQIRAFNTRTYDPKRSVPQVMMRNEDYGRIWRLIDDGRTVELEFDIVNQLYPEGRTAYNVIAEIPGTDRADEVVMLGGHLDAWHAGTGATDNGIGCAVMMEAARILAAAGVRPRRTIRVALWSGEEQGLLGSTAYVREHFGTFEEPKPEFAKLAAYFNIDQGTGQARGMSVFGPAAAGAVLREALAPFRDLGVIGATNTQNRGGGGNSDFASFNRAGLPGIDVRQDPIQYFTHSWHTNLDTYERIVEEDARKSAIVIASVVYHLAMRNELLPRFAGEQMPARPGGGQQTQ